jgi:hypothetical protein
VRYYIEAVSISIEPFIGEQTVPAPKPVKPQNDERNEEIEGGIGTLSNVMTTSPLPEVEVDPIASTARTEGGVPTVVIRVNEAIEDMSYVAAGRTERYTFEQGNRYRVPIYIAAELESLGKVWH